MSKKAVVWIRDDFRIKNNSALSYATNNYDTVTALYIYNKENFDDIREAQKWWVSKSLINFKNELIKYNIELELIFSDEITFFSKIKDKQEISVFWNKIYEPSQLKLDNDLIKIFEIIPIKTTTIIKVRASSNNKIARTIKQTPLIIFFKF